MHIWPIVLFCATIALLIAASVFAKREHERAKEDDLSLIISHLEQARDSKPNWGPTTDVPWNATTLSREGATLATSSRPKKIPGPRKPTTAAKNATTVRIIMQVVVSVFVLGAGIFIIISHEYDAKDKHWAYGSAGTILGYWLKG